MKIHAASAVIDGSLRQNVYLEVVNGIIASISDSGHADVHVTGTLIPGFVDIHCHGGGGYAFTDSNLDNVHAAIETHRQHGTSSLMASLVTAPLTTIHNELKRVKPLIDEGLFFGIHLEGPYLSHARCGAHDPELLIAPTIDDLKALLDAGAGAISMFTIAPELPGAIQAIEFLTEQGVVSALGHSQASAEQTRAALAAGASLITHYSNGMPKPPNGAGTITEESLDNSYVPLEIILDNEHVAPALMKDLWSAHNNRIVLITDAMAAAGKEDGDYKIGALDVEVKNSVARLKSNGSLAGSTLTMDRAFTNLITGYGATIPEAVQAASTLPAQTLKLQSVGEIKVGYRADFNELTSDMKVKPLL